jgi:hypothetical protein
MFLCKKIPLNYIVSIIPDHVLLKVVLKEGSHFCHKIPIIIFSTDFFDL